MCSHVLHSVLKWLLLHCTSAPAQYVCFEAWHTLDVTSSGAFPAWQPDLYSIKTQSNWSNFKEWKEEGKKNAIKKRGSI